MDGSIRVEWGSQFSSMILPVGSPIMVSMHGREGAGGSGNGGEHSLF